MGAALRYLLVASPLLCLGFGVLLRTGGAVDRFFAYVAFATCIWLLVTPRGRKVLRTAWNGVESPESALLIAFLLAGLGIGYLGYHLPSGWILLGVLGYVAAANAFIGIVVNRFWISEDAQIRYYCPACDYEIGMDDVMLTEVTACVKCGHRVDRGSVRTELKT